MRLISKPDKSEYPEYAEIYIKLLPGDGLILKHLKNNFQMIKDFIYSLPAEKLLYAYAEDKWTIKEILVHIVDDERIFAYRAMSFARNEKRPMPGFEQDDYAKYSGANKRDLENIFEEYEAVRNATIALFNGLPDEAFLRKGTGSTTFHSATVRALAYHIAGHEQRHINIIKERYL
ncbi:MAG: DinB family protein [Actinomycetota bacterium]